MRLECQTLLKSLPLNLLAGSAPCIKQDTQLRVEYLVQLLMVVEVLVPYMQGRRNVGRAGGQKKVEGNGNL